jgi:hypothetical protein
LVACVLLGCGGGVPEIASKNRTFYDFGSASGSDAGDYEQRYPPLDLDSKDPNLEYIGVTIVRGGVHLSRPKDWRIREASNEPGHAYIQYISPRASSFAIYERSDSPDDLWRDVLERFESDAESVGAKITGKAVPIATLKGQGRIYSVQRKVDAAKRPFVARSREIILRGDHRVVLVQVVRERASQQELDRELMRAITTIEVL